jgi:hypothetical protein
MDIVDTYGIPAANKIPNLSDKTRGILALEVTIEEKLDGSQFSFMVEETTGKLHMRSKGRGLDWETLPEKDAFYRAVQGVLSVKDDLVPGFRYIGETLSKPRHNILTYDKTPANNIALFDIVSPGGTYLDSIAIVDIANLFNMSCCPVLFSGKLDNIEQLDALLETESFLGGPKIEGVVIKARQIKDKYGFPLMAKYVSQKFREKHGDRKKRKTVRGLSAVDDIGAALCTEARWLKAVQHLRDNGRLTGTSKDIGPLMKECSRDIESEEKEWIKDRLYEAFRKRILKIATSGLPQWYQSKVG